MAVSLLPLPPSPLPHTETVTQPTDNMATPSPPKAPAVFGQPQEERQSAPPSPSSKRGLLGGAKAAASTVSLTLTPERDCMESESV